jgi:MoxR-like ATPase
MTSSPPVLFPGDETFEDDLPEIGAWAASRHFYRVEDQWAINAAIGARRPLLLLGKPGTGKSQLALAAAAYLQRAFLPKVVNANTEPEDLLWSYDAVGRLGDAQIAAVATPPAPGSDGGSAVDQRNDQSQARSENTPADSKRDYRIPLSYVEPGPLWWAFDWQSAKDHVDLYGMASCMPEFKEPLSHENGCVVLIDEIDKAEPEVPNGLLEVLGNGRFSVPHRTEPIGSNDGPAPLVIITTNAERELPDAFVRRCLVWELELPEDNKLEAFLVERGEVHFRKVCSVEILGEIARRLVKERGEARKYGRRLPGQAEYLDLVRAVCRIAALRMDRSLESGLANDPGFQTEQRAVLKKVDNYALVKKRGDI